MIYNLRGSDLSRFVSIMLLIIFVFFFFVALTKWAISKEKSYEQVLQGKFE